MARVRTGRPNGRPPSPLQGREEITTSITLSADVIQKIDRLRKGAETRRDIIERAIRDLPE